MADNDPKPPLNARAQPVQPIALSDMGQRVFESLSLGLIVFDNKLQIIHHNSAAAFLVDKQRSLVDALTTGTVAGSYEDWPKVLREVVEQGRHHRFDQVVYRDQEQRESLLNLQCIPLTDTANSTISGGTLVIEDVTAAVSMEKRLAVSERMAAVGKLAARVAHELNNPLDGILRYLNLSKRSIETGATDKLGEYIERARGGLLRMTEIVRELVEFSRSAHTAFDDASINTIVEESIKVMSDKAVQSNVSVVCTLQENMPAVRGTSLFQVFCNLVKNAVDAMPQGGTLTVTTRRDDHHVVIRFQDTGIGLPEEIERIFEPFFTTKPPGKGTGLGLAICKDMIEKYNGTITPQRSGDGGTIFEIRIPLESCTELRGTADRGLDIRHTSASTSAPRPSRFSSAPRQEESE